MSCLINVIPLGKTDKMEKSYFSNSLIISDLDKFFSEVYSYYYHGGYRNTVTKIILDNIIYVFTIHFLMFNIFFLEWKEVLLSNPDENIELSNYISTKNIKNHPFSAFLLYILLMYYYSNFLFVSFKKFFSVKNIHKVYKYKLHINEGDLETISFNYIMSQLIELQEKENYCRVKETLTKYDIISRITRKENYIIALISNKIITLKFLKFPMMTRYITQCLRKHLINFMINDVEINKRFYSVNYFRAQIIFSIVIQLLTIPGELILRTVFFLFKNADNFRNRSFSAMQWNNKTLIQFRNYNELPHHFDNRIAESVTSVNNFLTCYKQKFLSILHKSFVLIGGSIIFVFFVVTFLNIKLTKMTIFGVKFITLTFAIGIIISFFGNNSSVPDGSFIVREIDNFAVKKKYYKQMVKYLINVPIQWNKRQIYKNYKMISKCYYNGIVGFFYELVSIILFPFIWIGLFFQVNEIIHFVKLFSVNIPGIGAVCGFSVLNPDVFRNLCEKDIDCSNSFQRRFRDAKFLNSMIYYEREFAFNDENFKAILEEENEMYPTKNKLDFDDDNSNDDDDELFKKDESISQKTISKTEEILYEVYNNENKKNIHRSIIDKENKNEFYNNIFYYTTSSHDLDLTKGIEKLSNEKVSHINIK